MRAELIAVGTELLMGQIANTNGQYLARECAALGIDVYFQTVVGDNKGRIQEVLKLAKSRADVIILTGGLGPTQDDLTKEAVAEFVGRKVGIHEPTMQRIQAFFDTRGIHMVENNRRQALTVEGSHVLDNDTGLAAGDALTVDGTHYIMLPGPPREMKPMFENYVVPWLKSHVTVNDPLQSVMLMFAGIGESNLEHTLKDLIDAQTDPTIAPYAKEGEVAIRVTTRASTMEEAQPKLQPIVAEIRQRLGNHIYAEDGLRLEEVVVDSLLKHKSTLALAESCTGGLIADLLTNIPGSSQAVKGGYVCYSNAAKSLQLGIPLELLEGETAPGAISEECAAKMAEQARKLLDADYGLSVTGVAGPSESEGHPVGLIYIGLSSRGLASSVYRIQLAGYREVIKLRAAKNALHRLWVALNQK